ncbi:glycosyltransferase [Cyanobium sp. L1E-Cus]|uniref:glycosyltransferase n=1 Tax=Cyanobium sp. L1E-Cus TaxID=2823714 RepID=UPI0020CD7F47|nr:glycosyltransferase [Cyanobium sp. L1E-Cus]MCP9823428.1 glycosyltransferase [Cyanobium sp. L1E-Cus]
MNLANSLVDAGHQVVLWSSAFFHQEKRHRSKKAERIKISEQLEIRLISSPGYQRNIGLGRLWDHAVLAFNLTRQLQQEDTTPDVAFIGYPPIEVAAVLTRWLYLRDVPTILDVKDQWPSFFLEALPKQLRGIGRIALWPYYYLGRRAMREASGLSAMAEKFLEWSLDFAGRSMGRYDKIFPLTSPSSAMSKESLENALAWWSTQGIKLDAHTMRLVFIGSHMSVFDFQPVREAAEYFAQRNAKVEFVICGDGGFSVELRAMLAGLPNVFFPGWVDRAQIEALAEISQAALIPYRNIDNFITNLPNKVIDSLSLGLPILSPLRGEVAILIETHKVGLRYGSDSGTSLVRCIEALISSQDLRQTMSNNARSLYCEKFSYEMVYGSLVQHLEMIALRRHSQ